MPNKTLKILFCILLIFSCIQAQDKAKAKNSNRGIKTVRIGSKDYYEKLWIKVDELEKKGLTKQARDAAENIYQKSQSENNQIQMIKSLLVKFALQGIVEENSEDKFISTLKEKINSAKAPYRNILLSILAHTYEQYYKENLYKIYKRSFLDDSSSTSDYKVWDDRRFQKEITRLYLSSIDNSEMLSNIAVKDFSEIIKYEFGNLTITKATLLDMLGLSALNYFMDNPKNSVYSVSKEMDEFNMEDSSYLSDAKEFVKLKTATTDTLSLKYRAFRLFQLLMSYPMNRPNDKNSADDINTSKLLAEIDVMRMKFIYENRGSNNYDSLLIKALRKSALSSPSGPVSMVYWLKLAEYYVKFSNDSDSPETKKFNANAAAICDSLLKKENKSSESIEIKNLLKILKKKIQERYLNFTLQSTSAADKAFGALFEYRNIDTVFISIIPMNSINKKIINDEWEKIDSTYGKLSGMISFSRILKNDKDYMTHSVELALPPLKPGPYTLLVSDSKEYKSNTIAHKEFEISNLALLTRENHEKVELMVTNRLTGRPEKDVNINVYVDWYDLKSGKDTMRLDSKLVTDENGLAMFSGYTRVYELLLLKGGDTLRVNDFLSSGSSMVDTGTAERTYIFTDRAIYRPGQKIFFKGIISQLNMKQRTSKAVNEKDVCVTLFDANSQVIKQTNMKTNEFGAFSGEFDLPAGRLNGRWRISAGGSTQYFRVEEYKRPQFEVILDPQKENISINDTVIIKGKAVTYSGAPLTNASVKYKVNRSSGHYFWYPYSSESKEDKTIAEGKISTDSLGCFSFKFVTIGKEKKEQEDIIYRYSCSVTVTDATGETHGAENKISVSRHDLFLNADIPDVINSEENKSIKISAVNIEDEPLKAGVKTAVYRLDVPKEVLIERPWEKPDRRSKSDPENWQVLADGEKYEDEYPLESWKKAETVFQKQIEITGDSSIALSGNSGWKPGKYLIVLSAMGKKGEARFEKYFDVFSPSADLIPVNKPLWAAVITPKVKPGSYIKIAAGTGLKEANVLYEVEDKSGILLRKWITLNKGQRVLDFPVDKAEKDDLIVRMTAVYENQRYSFAERIRLQNPEMKLNITLESFRNKIKPGSKEEWRLKIKMPDGSPSKAELLASMYDMSLDALYLHSWEFTPFALSNTKMVEWERDEAFNLTETDHLYLRSDYFNVIDYNFPKIYLFGFSLSGDYRPGNILKSRKYQLKELKRLRFLPPVIKYDEQVTDEYIPTVEELYNVAPDSKNSEGQAGGVDYSLIEVTEAPKKDEIVKEEVMNKESGGKNYLNNKEVGVRKKLQETAFFYPHLVTNQDGEITFTFTAPEALTRWKLMTFAHTKDMHYGLAEKEVVTQKELMIQSNAPRFLREGDTLYFTARVTNLKDTVQSGTAKLDLFNAENNKPLDDLLGSSEQLQNFSLGKKENKSLSWKLIVPYGGVQAVTWRLTAATDSSTDGEEGQVPVLTNTQLVTESMPIELNGHEKKDLVFKNLEENNSTTLRQHRLTFEFTSDPVWYAVLTLPYLMEYPYDCSEQTFSKYFANSMAGYLVNSDPKIKQVFERWKKDGRDSLKSNLMKNQELKNIILEETPWLNDAKDENASRQKLTELFNIIKLADEKAANKKKLQEAQLPDGGWSWFKGMFSSRYISRHIIAGFGHLDKLNIIKVKDDNDLWNMLSRAIEYCDHEMYNEYNAITALRGIVVDFPVDEQIIHYLYARSYFKDVPLKAECQRVFDFWNKKAEEQWLSKDKYMQGMIALSAYRQGNKQLAQQIISSIKENAVISDEMGMYFKENQGWYWFDAPIERQSLIIEAFNEISKDTVSIDLMKKWLLKQKQTANWGTTRATTEACYALMLRGTNWMSDAKLPEVKIGGQNLEISASEAEAGTGYIKTSWDGDKVTRDMAKVQVKNNNSTFAWGAMHWQYFEQMDKIEAANAQLSLKKQVFLEIDDKQGKKLVPINEKNVLKPGDKLKVRIELKADRDMEYIHMKDMRASGFEPENVLSEYKYQDGLWYYESTKDAATNFFIEHLTKGTYVFEYPLRVVYRGAFSNGITTVQCMYAPEFSSHSNAVRLKVE